MDGENNGKKPYEQMDDLGGVLHPFFGFNTHLDLQKMLGKRIKNIKYSPKWLLKDGDLPLFDASPDQTQGDGSDTEFSDAAWFEQLQRWEFLCDPKNLVGVICILATYGKDTRTGGRT